MFIHEASFCSTFLATSLRDELDGEPLQAMWTLPLSATMSVACLATILPISHTAIGRTTRLKKSVARKVARTIASCDISSNSCFSFLRGVGLISITPIRFRVSYLKIVFLLFVSYLPVRDHKYKRDMHLVPKHNIIDFVKFIYIFKHSHITLFLWTNIIDNPLTSLYWARY